MREMGLKCSLSITWIGVAELRPSYMYILATSFSDLVTENKQLFSPTKYKLHHQKSTPRHARLFLHDTKHATVDTLITIACTYVQCWNVCMLMIWHTYNRIPGLEKVSSPGLRVLKCDGGYMSKQIYPASLYMFIIYYVTSFISFQWSSIRSSNR